MPTEIKKLDATASRARHVLAWLGREVDTFGGFDGEPSGSAGLQADLGRRSANLGPDASVKF